jgi:predicted dehydrogenase
MDKVKIGFIGTGGMGQAAHLRNYSVLADCEIACIAEMREGMARHVAARYGIPRVYQDHREMLSKEKLDGVIASQPFDRHCLLLPEVFGKVSHVFTEKPIAVAVESGEALAQLSARTKTIHMVGYHKRSDPATVYAKRIIDGFKADKRLGAMKYVRILMPAGDWIAGGFDILIPSDKNDVYPAPSGNPDTPRDFSEEHGKAYVSFVNYYIHQVNLLRHLLGEPYRVTFAEKSGVLLAGESASGVACVIEMSPYRTTQDWQEEALVAFEKGYVKLTLPAPLTINRAGTVEIFEDPGNGATPIRTLPVLPMIHAMKAQAQNFIKVCRGEMAPPCGAAEAVQDLHVARDYIRMRFGNN